MPVERFAGWGVVQRDSTRETILMGAEQGGRMLRFIFTVVGGEGERKKVQEVRRQKSGKRHPPDQNGDAFKETLLKELKKRRQKTIGNTHAS